MPSTVGYPKNGRISRRLSKAMTEKLASARDRLQFGMQYREQKRQPAWERSLDQYNNELGWDVRDDDDMDIVNVNISFSTINTLVPYVSDEDPHFVVKPYSGDATVENASLLETFINHLWQSPEVEGKVYLADIAWDWLVFGDAYGIVTWKITEEPQYDARGDVIEGRGVEKAQYEVARISPWDLWIDPYSDGVHNARWVCRRLVVPVDELKSDDRYKIVGDLAGGDVGIHNSEDPEDQERMDYMAADGGWVAVYEFYDLVENWMLAFPMDGEHPFRYIEGIKCPIVQLSNYRISNSPYHVGELENIFSLQEELNKTRSQMVTHRRRNISKWLVRADLVGEKAIEAMKSSIINDIIPIEGNEPFARLVEQLTPDSLSPDSYMQNDVIRNDINEVTGVNEYLRGAPADISRTATEASIIEGATNVRTRHKLNQVETFTRRLGQRLLDIISETITMTDFDEMRMYITGREAEKLNRVRGAENLNTDIIFTPTPEVFQGRYVVDVERGSIELRNPMAKAQKYKDMFQIMASSMPIMQQFGVPINLKRILELWFEAEGVDDIDALFMNDDQQSMMQQAALLQQMGMLPSGGAGGGGMGVPPSEMAQGDPSRPGQARPEMAMPPAAQVSPANSGMLPPR